MKLNVHLEKYNIFLKNDVCFCSLRMYRAIAKELCTQQAADANWLDSGFNRFLESGVFGYTASARGPAASGPHMQIVQMSRLAPEPRFAPVTWM